jgi:protein phosphatase
VIRLASGAATDVGRVRTLNEDSYLVAERLFAVADGMGGHRGGEVASADALAAFRGAVIEPTVDDLVGAVATANRAVFNRSMSDPELAGMGTTLCAIALVDTDEGERMAVVNVGDSRVYLLHDDEFVQLSEDHSLVEEMVRDGQLTPDEAADHPRRNVLTRVVGVDADVSVDSWSVEPHPGDRFLLCSDGLFNELHDDQISAVLRRLGAPTEAARELVRLAADAGGRDNITVIVVDVTGDAEGGAPLIGSRLDRLSDPDAPPIGLGSTFVAASEPPASPEPSPDDDVPVAGRPTGAARARLEGHWRTAVFVVAVLAVFGIAFAAIAYTARSTYFVANDRGEVVIFRGRKGGLLWFHPTIVERSGIRMGQLTDHQAELVDEEKEQPDLATAQRVLGNLRQALALETTTTTVPVTHPATTPTVTSPTTTLLAPPGSP